MFHSAVNCTSSTFHHILQEISSGEGYKIEHPERDKVEHIAEIPITKSNGYAIICHHFLLNRFNILAGLDVLPLDCSSTLQGLFSPLPRLFNLGIFKYFSSFPRASSSRPARAFLSHSLTFSTASRPLQGNFSRVPLAFPRLPPTSK